MRLIGLCTAALLGLALGDVRHLDAPPLALAATFSGLAAALSWRQPRWRLLALGVTAAALGGLRVALVPHAESPSQAARSPASRVLSQPQSAVPPAHDAMSSSQVAVPPANAIVSPAQTAVSQKEAGVPSASGVLSQPQSAVPPAHDAMSSSQSAVPPANGVLSLPQSAVPPANGALFSPQSAVPQPQAAGPPANGALSSPQAAVSQADAAGSPAEAAPSSAAAAPSPPERPRQSLEPYLNTSVRLGGTVVGTPTRTATGLVRLALNATCAQRAPRPGGSEPPALEPVADSPTQVLVVGEPASRLTELGEDDSVVLEGRLVPNATRGPPALLNPGVVTTGQAAAGAIGEATNAAALKESASQAAVAELGRALASLRRGAVTGIQRYLPEPQASLAAGVLLGGSGRLDDPFRSDLQRSGLAHLVAIDGFKQVVLAAAIGGPLAWVVGARLAVLTSVASVAGYTLLTGAHPSAVRAGLMVGLASVATLTGRVADPLTSLLLAVLSMALVEPPILRDVGLQLSLSATLGIVLFWPRLRRWLRRIPRPLAEPIGLTLAVTVGTLPVTLSAFQVVSLVSPIAHVLAVPLLAPVLFGAALLGLLAPIGSLALVAAWLAWLPTTLLVGVIRIFGELPAAAVWTGRLPGLAALGLAGVLLAWGVWGLPELSATRMSWRRWRNSHRAVLMPMACVGGCLGAVAMLSLLRPDGQLHVEPLAVGRGQALFIRGPTGHTALVVSGRAASALVSAQVAEHLAVWEHKLDVLVALDADGYRSAAATLGRYPADQHVQAQSGWADVDVGGGQQLRVSERSGQLVVSSTSAPTTSAARPGSPD